MTLEVSVSVGSWWSPCADNGPVVSKALIELPYDFMATRGQKREQAHLPRRPVFLSRASALCRRGGWVGWGGSEYRRLSKVTPGQQRNPGSDPSSAATSHMASPAQPSSEHAESAGPA